MKDLGVFITTHLQKGYRHGRSMESKMFYYFRDKVIGNYLEYDSGLGDNYDIYICDTGSTDITYLQWVNNLIEEEEYIHKISVPNKCGFTAAQKYLMHVNPTLADKYKYIIFHVDDITHPTADGWGADLIEKWESIDNLGIMGRFLNSIRLSKDGLIDHRNCCPHIAEMWGIEEVTTIPHLHGEYWMMDRDTLRDIAGVWWDPVKSEKAMAWQKKWEEEDFCKLADINDGRRTLDYVHIGRETDMPLRMDLIGKRMGSYKGTKFWPNCIEPYKTWKEYKEFKYEDS